MKHLQSTGTFLAISALALAVTLSGCAGGGGEDPPDAMVGELQGVQAQIAQLESELAAARAALQATTECHDHYRGPERHPSVDPVRSRGGKVGCEICADPGDGRA